MLSLFSQYWTPTGCNFELPLHCFIINFMSECVQLCGTYNYQEFAAIAKKKLKWWFCHFLNFFFNLFNFVKVHEKISKISNNKLKIKVLILIDELVQKYLRKRVDLKIFKLWKIKTPLIFFFYLNLKSLQTF